MTVYAFDLETELIAVGKIAPPPVCSVIKAEGAWTSICHAKDPQFVEQIEEILQPGNVVVGANTRFDMAVLVAHRPELTTLIFEAYADGRIHDVQLIQGLIDLGYDGKLMESYSLDELGKHFGWRDRSTEKFGGWRMRYAELMDVPMEKWPESAIAYAKEDADETLHVYLKQMELAEQGHTIAGHEFESRASFALQLIQCQGIWTDKERAKRASDAVTEVMDSCEEVLVESGVLRPYKPPRWWQGKWTLPRQPTINKTALAERIVEVCEREDIKVKRTTTKLVSTNKEFLAELGGLDRVIDEYRKREEVKKLASTYLPNLRTGIVYTEFNPLVSTGRSSSRKSSLVPSMNLQNQPRLSGKLSVRECMIPRPGHYICSVDYSSLELCTLAWTCRRLFGESVLYDFINEYGASAAHEFLGAQIAYAWYEPFKLVCDEGRCLTPTERFLAFRKLKEVDKAAWKKFRTFAKPTGLGYPGGLGPETFRTLARGTYGVKVTLREAERLRDLWFATYPEMRRYFAFINRSKDRRSRGRYYYEGPTGMIRRGCSFTAASNGAGLQTPSAFGAKTGVWDVVRAQFDPSLGSSLLGTRSLNFVHDELIAELPIPTAHEQALEISSLMVDAMTRSFPGIRMEAEPALMERWYKDAEPVYDETGRLIPWRPDPLAGEE